MAAPYIPARDVDLVVWADNFAALITAAPATYGLSPTDASTIQASVDAWDAAYTLAVNPATRTPTTVAAKNTAKNAMVPILRTYASQIRINPGVMDSDKIALGLNLPNNSPSPIPAPATQAVLTITSATPLRHTLKFRDELASPTSRAKAPNSIGCEIWRGVSTIGLTDPGACTFYGMAVKVPFYSDFDPADAGKIATYFARWANRAGSAGNNIALTGPWSNALSQTIVGAG
jgi:hypothetical protein